MTGDRSRRLAAWTFGAYAIVAWALTTFVFARYNWFATDDWNFLAHRQAGSIDDLLTPYNGHWSTVPILVMKVEFRLFGLRYWPYVGVVMAMHLCAAVLLRALLRRAAVHPWLATFVAGLFVLYGPGDDNLVWSFQVGMVGSLLAGLLQLWLAGRDEPTPLTDGLAVLVGAIGLMTSSAAVVMVLVVAVAVFLRRGWRAAAVQVVPLALLYGVWYVAYGHEGDRGGRGDLVDWVREGFVAAFEGIGHWSVLGAVLALAVAAGAVALGLRARTAGWDAVRARCADAVGGAVGAAGFLVLTGLTRSEYGSAASRTTRYVHVTSALLLLGVGVALHELVGRRPRVLLGVCAVLLVPLIANSTLVGIESPFAKASARNDRLLISALPDSPLARRIDPASVPARLFFGEPGPPIGWLLQAHRAGRIPDQGPDQRSPRLRHEVRVRLSVIQFGRTVGTGTGLGTDGDGEAVSPKDLSCRTSRRDVRLQLREGDRIGIPDGATVRFADAPAELRVPYSPSGGWQLRVVADRVDLRLGPYSDGGTFQVCLPR